MTQQLRIIYAGTPDFAVPALRALLEAKYNVVAVYTQPDRPAGRGRRLTASPIKQLAEQYQISVEQPSSLRSPEAQNRLIGYAPELILVAAYGLILPHAILSVPRLGCVNIHASLLPRWRGAAPIHRALLAGDNQTGITLMQMDEGLDTGDILAKHVISIGEDLNSGQLHDQLSALGAHVLMENMPDLINGHLVSVRQDHSQANYANKLDKTEAWIDWGLSAAELERKVRAFNPWPVAQTHFNDQVLRIWHAEVSKSVCTEALAGQVIQADSSGIEVATGSGCLRLVQVQLPGGKVLQAADFINAHDVVGLQLK